MITTKYVRDNVERIRESLERRRSNYPLDELLKLDEQSRAIQTKVQELRKKRNAGSIEVSNARKEGKKVADSRIRELADVKKEIEELEAKDAAGRERIDSLLWNMPNVLDESVPYGKDETGNVEIRKAGAVKKRSIPSHIEILERLGLVDIEQAAKVSGARFYYLKGELALLEQALIRFAIDRMVAKGYELIAPPLMLKKEYYRGATALGDFEEALYKVADTAESAAKKDFERLEDELFLISTSEHTLAALNAGRVFSGGELPKRYVAVSPCFRREAGSHGKDTKGIFRVHHFYKIEQFALSRQEDSPKMFDELLGNAEGLWKELGMPYHVINICTGDIGTVAAKKHDIDVYMPGQDRYREVVSGSNCTDWQSLRLDIKYDEKGERRYAHTLNCTAIATSRALVAMVENYYTDKGTIKVPEALVPYMNGKREIGKA